MRSLAAVAGRKLTPFHGADGAGALVRLKVRTNSGVEVPIGQSTGCP